MFERNRQACEDLGLLWVPYIFLRPDDKDRTIRYFLDLVGENAPPAALDWEAEFVGSEVVEAWIDALPRLPLCYYGMWPPAAATAKIARCPRWYPQYPGSATAASRLPMWAGTPDPDWRKCWLIWQWSAKGALDGVSGSVDLNRLACSAEQFAAWHATGDFNASLPNAPKLQPTGMPNAIKPHEKIEAIQMVLGAEQDGLFGKDSLAALNSILSDAGQRKVRFA